MFQHVVHGCRRVACIPLKFWRLQPGQNHFTILIQRESRGMAGAIFSQFHTATHSKKWKILIGECIHDNQWRTCWLQQLYNLLCIVARVPWQLSKVAESQCQSSARSASSETIRDYQSPAVMRDLRETSPAVPAYAQMNLPCRRQASNTPQNGQDMHLGSPIHPAKCKF